MKIFLGDRPRQMTIAGEQCIELWKKTFPFVLDTERLTPVHMRLDDEDVLALFYALIDRYRENGKHKDIMRICAEVLERLAAATKEAVTAIVPEKSVEQILAEFSDESSLTCPDVPKICHCPAHRARSDDVARCRISKLQ